jgi:hypothetical protein
MTLLELQKMAEAVKEELKKPHPAAILGKSILGLGVGTGIGYGVGKGIDHLIGKGGLPMSTVAKFLPLVGGATSSRARTSACMKRMRRGNMSAHVNETAALSFPDSSFRYTPLRHLRVLFIRFLQGLFYAAPRGQYHWDSDDLMSEILITNEGRLDPETVNKRPAIICTRGPVSFYSLGIDDLNSFDFATGRKEKVVLVPGTMTINCVSRVPIECEDIAWVVAEHLWLLRDLLMRAGFFEVGRQPQIGAPSPAGSIIANDEGQEFTVVAVNVGFQLSRKSSYTPLNKVIVNSITQALSIAPPKRVYSAGNSTGVNVHECFAPSFAPNASDTRGHTPDPAHLKTNYLPKVPHPLDPSKLVYIKRVFPHGPGQSSLHPATVPIEDVCVKESTS